METEGESRTERLLWAVMLGDLLSLQLAARRGIDPLRSSGSSGSRTSSERRSGPARHPARRRRHNAEHGRPRARRRADLTKVYGEGETAVRALDGVDIEIGARGDGRDHGPVGLGKSTLLHLLGRARYPELRARSCSAGERYDGLGDGELTRLRRDKIGFVFQFFNLLASLSAEENVLLPALIAGRRDEATRERARELLERVGLGERAHHLPAELSGGEQQRVSIARALLTEPEIVLADEPTGNLDTPLQRRRCSSCCGELNEAEGQTLVLVTHDPAAAAIAGRVVFLRDGRVAGEVPGGSTQRVVESLTRAGRSRRVGRPCAASARSRSARSARGGCARC